MKNNLFKNFMKTFAETCDMYYKAYGNEMIR